MKRLIVFIQKYLILISLVTIGLVSLALQLTHKQTLAHWLLAIGIISLLLIWLYEQWQELRSGHYGIHFMAPVAIIFALILGKHWASFCLLAVVYAGSWVDLLLTRRLQEPVKNRFVLPDNEFKVQRKGKLQLVSAEQIRAGDVCFLAAGQMLPVEATLVSQSASFTAPLLGTQSGPHSKQEGDLLLSGSVCLDDNVSVKTTDTLGASQLSLMARRMQHALNSQAPYSRVAERYSVSLMFIALAIAVISWAMSGQAVRFLEVILVVTPAAFLSAPRIVALRSIILAIERGVFANSAGAWERLSRTRTMVFNKSGTLTASHWKVASIKSYGAYSSEQILILAASAEQNINHPIARAIVDKARGSQLKMSKVKHIIQHPQQGLELHFRGQEILLGNKQLLLNHGVELPKSLTAASSQTNIHLSINGILAGSFTLENTVRQNVGKTILGLTASGLQQSLVVTGDDQSVADHLAQDLQITKAVGSASPADKLQLVTSSDFRPTAFVSQNPKDMPLITAADIGIAFNAASIGPEGVDIYVPADELQLIASAYALSRKAASLRRMVMVGGLSLSLAAMAVAATGALSPVLCALLQFALVAILLSGALFASGSLKNVS